MTTAVILRLILFASSIGGVVACCGYALKRPERWGYIAPALVLVLNIAIFSGSRLLLGVGILTPGAATIFNLWGNIIMLQVAFTVVGGVAVLWNRG